MALEKYNNILYLPHPVSKNHPQMPIADRAAQFSPFAALTGYEAAIEESRRLTDSKKEMEEERKDSLNRKLQVLLEHINEKPSITAMYFQPDIKKAGGKYLTITGKIKKIEAWEQCIVMEDGSKIPMEYLYEIDVPATIEALSYPVMKFVQN